MIYLDWSATTPICESAKEAIIKNLDNFGNPSSLYDIGRKSKSIIEEARNNVAQYINADPSEIFFTSGGSESNSWALNHKKYISTDIEHHSIPQKIFRIPVMSNGLINISSFDKYLKLNKKILKADTFACTYVNNEIGTIQDLYSIEKIVHNNNLDFHVDATQAMAHMRIDVKKINCDTLSFSGHKIGASKGIGILFIKNGTKMFNLINGGMQEYGMRPGTENILGIVSLNAAIFELNQHIEEWNNQTKILKNKFLENLKQIPYCRINNFANQIDSIISARFIGVNSKELVQLCNNFGVYFSTGSACNEGLSVPSHVLIACGFNKKEAREIVRFSISHYNTTQEINDACDIIEKIIRRLRKNEK